MNAPGISGIDKIIHGICNSEFKFYLTGSRYFGNYNQGSDHDFFVNNSAEVREFLNKLGFKLVDTVEVQYNDTNTHGVLELEVRSIKIHVQLVENASLKHSIQLLILESHLMYAIKDKGDKRRFWNLCYELVNHVPDSSHANYSITRSSNDWCKVRGIKITSWLGWIDEPLPPDQLITEYEFIRRLGKSEYTSV